MKLAGPAFAFVAGILAGTFLVFRNPLAGVGEVDPLALTTVSKRYLAPNVRGFDIGLRPFLGAAPGDGSLEDAANRYARISVVVLPAGDNFPAALAVKAQVLSSQNSLWRARLGTLDYWVIAWPGEGAVFAAGYSNYWHLLRDLLLSSLRGQGEQALDERYSLTALPPQGFETGIVGALGRFAGQPGELREHLLPRAGDQPTWQLDVRLDRARQ